ncbi:MAG: hypothetical protein Q9188_000222 [Gyalolechia gomerana]
MCVSNLLILSFPNTLNFSASFDVTEDSCTAFPSVTPDGKTVKGATVFVKNSGPDNKRLPMDQQNPAYSHDGVAAPQSVFEAWVADPPDSPVSAATTAAPTTATQLPTEPAATRPVTPTVTSNPQPSCDCNENGCTGNSQDCCANGTCDKGGTCDTPNCD